MNASDIETQQFDITLVLTALHLYPAAIKFVKLNLSISIPDEREVPCGYVFACNSIVNFANRLSHSLEKKADTPTISYLSESKMLEPDPSNTMLEQPEVFDLELDLVRWVKMATGSAQAPLMQKPAGQVTQFYGLDSKSR